MGKNDPKSYGMGFSFFVRMPSQCDEANAGSDAGGSQDELWKMHLACQYGSSFLLSISLILGMSVLN